MENYLKRKFYFYCNLFRKGSAPISPAADNNLPNNAHKTREEIEHQKLEEEEEEMKTKLAKVALAPKSDNVNLN